MTGVHILLIVGLALFCAGLLGIVIAIGLRLRDVIAAERKD